MKKMRNRLIVKAYVTYDMTYRQIGEEFGISPQAIAYNVKRYLRKEIRRFALAYPWIFMWKHSEWMKCVIPEIDSKMLSFLCEFWTIRSGERHLLRKYQYLDWGTVERIQFDKRIKVKRLKELVRSLYDTIGGYTIEEDI